MTEYDDDEDTEYRYCSQADEWWGILDGGILHDEDAEALCSQTDVADNRDWTSFTSMVKDFVRIHPNQWKPDDPSLDTLLHRVARGGGPVEVTNLLLKYGAWRNIRNAHGERPLDIARKLHHEHLVEMLEPKFMIDVPTNTLEALQAQFHDLITTILSGDFDDDFQLRQVMPDLSVLPERYDLGMVWLVSGMYGGFRYCLDRDRNCFSLRVTAWSRVGGMDDNYLVTPTGWAAD